MISVTNLLSIKSISNDLVHLWSLRWGVARAVSRWKFDISGTIVIFTEIPGMINSQIGRAIENATLIIELCCGGI